MTKRSRDARSPRVETVKLTDLTAASEPAAYESDGLALTGNFDGQSWRDRSFLECSLTDVSLDATALNGASFTDCVLERCAAAVLQLPSSRWRRVDIFDSRFGAAELHGTSIESVRIIGSRWDFVNLRAANIRDVLFEGCRIDELDLGMADVTRMRFVDCTVASLVLHGATLDGVDLRGAAIGTIDGVEHLRGTTIDALQLQQLAPQLAAQLGITLEADTQL